MRAVEVIWDDANFEDEFGIVDAPELELVRLHTVGYLAAETDDGIVLAMTDCPDDKKVVTEQMVIPWGMIAEWGDLVPK